MHTRPYANGTIIRLRKIVPEGLEKCTSDMIRKFFRTCRDYEHAYREGSIGKYVEVRVKVYKSHRKVNIVVRLICCCISLQYIVD